MLAADSGSVARDAIHLGAQPTNGVIAVVPCGGAGAHILCNQTIPL
jgi:hypothetical protein